MTAGDDARETEAMGKSSGWRSVTETGPPLVASSATIHDASTIFTRNVGTVVVGEMSNAMDTVAWLDAPELSTKSVCANARSTSAPEVSSDVLSA
jgi:hypothetical protein